MATFVFTCCGRTVTDPNQNGASATFEHLCIGDVPCIGLANNVNPASATIDVPTEIVDPGTGTVVGTDGGTPTNGDGQ